MYWGQLETTSFLSVAETSLALHNAGSCWAPATEKNGSFSAARLAPAKATPPAPRSTVRRLRPAPPGPDICPPRLPTGSDRVMRTRARQGIPYIEYRGATKSGGLTVLDRWCCA